MASSNSMSPTSSGAATPPPITSPSPGPIEYRRPPDSDRRRVFRRCRRERRAAAAADGDISLSELGDHLEDDSDCDEEWSGSGGEWGEDRVPPHEYFSRSGYLAPGSLSQFGLKLEELIMGGLAVAAAMELWRRRWSCGGGDGAVAATW
ncbi:hypothetical protein LINPERHAP1_LOCUS13548 [Linum perenne]